MAASGNRRRVIGRTLRRSRRLSTRGEAAPGAGKATGPLQAIEENTVVSLMEPSSALRSATLRHFASSPAKKRRSSAAGSSAVAAGAQGKKRQRESLADKPSANSSSSSSSGESKRQREMLELLDELEDQVQERCKDLLSEAERKADELRMELKMQLMVLPAAVRQMPWRTFAEDFDGSLANVTSSSAISSNYSHPTDLLGSAGKPVASRTRRQSRASTSRSSILSTTARTSRPSRASRSRSSITSSSFSIVAETPGYGSRRLSAFQTPQFTAHKTRAPSTVLRTARKGEMTYSAHGSPIIPETVVKAPAGSLVATFDADSALQACLTLDDGHELDLSDPDKLTGEARANTRSKMEALQAKVNEILKKLHGNP